MSELAVRHGTTRDLINDAQHVRRIVFIEGQNVPEERELDGLDDKAQHYVGYIEGIPAAVARTRHIRINQAGDKIHDQKIERVGVLPVHQGQGFGSQLMRFILAQLSEEQSVRNAILESQVHALDFYKEFGFASHRPSV